MKTMTITAMTTTITTVMVRILKKSMIAARRRSLMITITIVVMMTTIVAMMMNTLNQVQFPLLFQMSLSLYCVILMNRSTLSMLLAQDMNCMEMKYEVELMQRLMITNHIVLVEL